MQTITIELLDDKALKLLQELEALNILRLVESGDRPVEKKRKWAGSISEKSAELMLKELEQSRKEWERDI